MSVSESTDLTIEEYAEYDNKKDPKAPVYTALVFFILLIGLFAITYVIDARLPTPLTIADEKNHHYEFIGERARKDLKELMQIGPRVKGSPENENFTVAYILNKIQSIKNEAYFNKKIDIDVQTVSGAYNFYDDEGAINAYEKVQNIVVKLYNERRSQESVLINVHFDSVPISPGGSDDGINCVVALEVLRKLSKFSESFEYNFIFLFNGSEETPMQAGHGFITQHKWAKEAKVVINLEAGGAAGKSMLFQVGPKKPWLLNYYKKAPHAYANVLGEELYLSGLVPSDTDFRIFNTFGNISGFDFVLVKDAYRYHTSFDGFDNIPDGTYQYIGDNTLSLVCNLANAKELKNVDDQPTEGVIYFDFVSLFLISYTQTIAIIMHSVLVVLTLIIIVKSLRDFKLGFDKQSLLYLIITLGVVLLGWILSAACVLLIGVILDAVKCSMSWYGNLWLLIGLYVVPIVICNCGLLVVLNRFNPIKADFTASNHAQIQALAILFVWTILLIVLTILRLRSAYLIFLPIVFQSVMMTIINLFHLQEKLKIWPFIYIAGTILPNMALIPIASLALEFMVPVAGRSGNHSNPEMLIGMLTFLLTLLITSFYIPLISIIRKPIFVLIGLLCIFILFLILAVTPVGFPYSGNVDSPKPQRYWIYHASRIFRNDTNQVYKRDSGFFIANADRNSPRSIEGYVEELANATSIEDDCSRSLYCGLPLERETVMYPEEITWIPAERPLFTDPIDLVLNSKTSISKTILRYSFTATGPDSMEVYLSAIANVNIISIDLVPNLPKPRIWNGRPMYVVLCGWAKEKISIRFSVDVKVPESYTGSTLNIALVGKYLHVKTNINMPGYQKFLDQFPHWADVVPMLSAYESWVY